MESLRPHSRPDSEKSEERRQRSESDATVQNAANTMIAITESYRHHFQDAQTAVPNPPPRSYSHSRSSSSGSSTSSQHFLGTDIERQMSFSNLSWSSSPQYRAVSLHDDESCQVADNSSYTLVQEESDSEAVQQAQPVFNFADDLIRLSTPNLPPRLNTPPTLSLSNSFCTEDIADQGCQGEERPVFFRNWSRRGTIQTARSAQVSTVGPVSDFATEPDSDLVSPVSEGPVFEGALAEASRRMDVFRANAHTYMTIRPEGGNEAQPLDPTTQTQTRTASEGTYLFPQGVRRKPLAPGAKTLDFNHSFTNEILFVFVICMAQMLAWAGLAQTLVPARNMAESFPRDERTTGHLAWYTSAYALGTGTFIMFGHRLGRIFGCKSIFVAGYFWFAFWSLLAGLSVYVKVSGGACTAFFCVCRALQGLGPALLIPNGQALLQRAYPPCPRRVVVMALFDAATPVGFLIGTVMTSLFGHFSSWAWSFYSLSTVCLALATMSMLNIPSKTVMMHDIEGSLWRRLDVFGVVCGIGGLILFSVGWNQAPVVSFNNAQTYVLIIIGILFIAGLVYIELTATHPLFPFKQMEAATAVTIGCTAASWAAFGIWVWYLIQFIEVLRGWELLRMSAGFVPLLIVGVIAAVIGTRFLHKEMAAHWALFIGSVAIFISSALMATAPAKQSYWLNAFFSILIMPVGMVLSFPATVGVLGRSLPEGYHGLAGSLTGASVGYALSLGLGMAGSAERDALQNGATTFRGYRSAQYLGLGFSVLSVLLALSLLVVALLRRWNASKKSG